jgi:protein-disulfide isomerase
MARKLVLFVGALILVLLGWTLAVEAAQRGPKISVGDDPSLKEGSPGLVLVEVSDFQCPFCGRGVREVLTQVYDKFVRSGKVELIYLDLPLQMHAYAFKAAEAAACAGDQNMFWDMHHQLFGNQSALSPEKLPGYAEEAGLDVAAFQKCLSSGKHGPGIREDMRTAQNLGITGTPAYLLGRRIPGGDKIQVLEIVKGVPTYEALEEKINALLTAK